ncbi:two-component hybrid sensor and regulator [Calothrix brevissima NIES-22]|nr:two-component hybrid sensor and regulator [Calothrix brevissima NIES-22]
MAISHYTILLLEDSPEDRSLYCRYLNQDLLATYNIVESDTVITARKYLAQNQPDLIILDYQLPDMNGLAFLEQLRWQYDSLPVPVIMLTGQGDEAIAAQAIKLGAAEYLAKGKLTCTEFCQTVHSTLEKTFLQQQIRIQEQQQLLLARILLRIRQFLGLKEILSIAVQEVRELLKADRAIVYQFDSQMNGTIVAESVLPQWKASLNYQIQDSCFRENQGVAYLGGKIRAIADIYNAGLTDCHIHLLEQFGVKANLVVPILMHRQNLGEVRKSNTQVLWGLLIAHQCSTTREWQTHELSILEQLSVHLAVAIQQAELYENLQILNKSLEEKVEVRTQELQASDRRFRAIFNNTFQFTGLLTTEGILLEANQTALDFGGVKREDVINQPFWETYWWKNSPAIQQRLKQAIALAAQGEFIRYEVDIMGAGEQITTIDFSLRPLKDESGKVVMLIPEGRDISARKQAEATLQLQAQILDEIHDGVISTDIHGIIQTWNQSAAKLFGYTPTEVIGQPVSLLYFPEDLEQLSTEVMEPLLQNGSHATEVRNRTKTGEEIYISLRLSVMRDNQGNIIRLLGCSHNISEHKKVEKALLESQILLQVVMDSLPIAIFWKDRNCRYLGCNRQLLLDAGLTSTAEIIGKTDFDMVWREQAALYQASDRLIMASGQPQFNIEEPFTKTGNLHRWLRTNKIPLRNSDDEIIAIIASYEDITERKEIEQALQQSERRYATLAASAPVGIYRTDIGGNCLYVNEHWCEITGLTLAEVVADGWKLALHSEDREMVTTQWQHLVQSGENFGLEYRFVRRDGVETWVFGQAVPEKHPDGTVIGYVGTITNINRRKQAEQERDRLLQVLALQNQTLEAQVAQRTADLKQSKERFQNLVETSSDWVWEVNEASVYTYVSPQIMQILGYVPEEVLGKTPFDLMPPQEAERVLNELMKFVFEQVPFQCLENINRHKDGRLITLETNAVPIFDDDGQFRGYRGMARDITVRKQAQEQLRNLSDRLNLAVKSAQIGIWDWDLLNDSLVWDERMYELFGVSPTNFDISQGAWEKFSQLLHPDDKISIRDNFQQVINSEKELDTELRIILSDGEIRTLKAYGLVQRNSQGQAQRIIGINYDISHRKLAEIQLQQTNQQLAASNAELARATRLKDEFLATMSHELRTPLNAILGITEALQDEIYGIITEKQKQSLQTIEQSGNHLLELINDILDLSKIEAGQLELHYTKVAINPLCQASLAFIKQQAFQKRIQLEVKIQPYLPELMVDERRIRQVLINLLNNAVKFTPAGGRITLEVTYEKLTLEAEMTSVQNFIRIAVIDTGIGIAPKNLNKLFQPFIQIDSALNRQYNGTGLGLVLVKRLVEIHGGKVGVSSELGVGSCFTVDLPCGNISEAAELVNSESSKLNSPLITTAENSPLILLAEDNEANIFTFSTYLEAVGYRMILARNGQEAIALTKSQSPNLILMDIQMPVVDGLEAIQQIRLDPNFTHLPIIALTALAMPGDEEKCLVGGANKYLCKPVKLQQLVALIQQLLDASKS